MVRWYGGTVVRWYGGTPSAIPRSAVEVKALGRWLVSRVLARSRALLFIPKEFQPDSARIGLENFGEHSRENARKRANAVGIDLRPSASSALIRGGS